MEFSRIRRHFAAAAVLTAMIGATAVVGGAGAAQAETVYYTKQTYTQAQCLSAQRELQKAGYVITRPCRWLGSTFVQPWGVTFKIA